MKRILSASLGLLGMATAVQSALAADIPASPIYKAPVAVAPVSTWTGCYFGIVGGGAWGRSQHEAPLSGLDVTNRFDIRGAQVGGTTGCNFQYGMWVFGSESDWSWSNKRGSSPNLVFPAFTAHTDERWFSTSRARLGVAWDRWMIYGTGGLAVASIRIREVSPAAEFEDTRTRVGWTAGVGVETMIWNNWSLKLEYLYADFRNDHYVIGGRVNDVRLNDHIVRAGLNYHFNWGGPVFAKY